jgi:hypothetical protein
LCAEDPVCAMRYIYCYLYMYVYRRYLASYQKCLTPLWTLSRSVDLAKDTFFKIKYQ